MLDGNPTTATGTTLSVIVPFPSWPNWLPPQHRTPPAFVSAQAYPWPAEIAATSEESPEMGTGTLLTCAFPRSASQQSTAPAFVSAHSSPVTEMLPTPAVSPVTATGTSLSAVESFPSCPYSLSPQQRTPPIVVRAHVLP